MRSPKNRYIKNQFAPLTLAQKLGIIHGRRAFTGPIYAQIGVTDRCNLNCLCCWFHSPLIRDNPYRSQHAELSFDDYCRLLRGLHKLGCRYIIIVGFGEPFLHPRIIHMLAEAKRTGFNCGVCTNGVLLTESMVNELIDMRLDRLDVSVWAGSAASYVKTHPGCSGKIFERIGRALLLIKELKREKGLDVPYVKILNVICNANYTDIEEMIDFGIEAGAEEVIFQPMMTVPGETDSLLLSDDEAALVREKLITLRSKVENCPLKFVNIDEYLARISSARHASGDYDLGMVHRIPCTIGWRFVVTLANGDVLACCNGSGKPLGNFLRQPMKEIWNSPAYREFRKRASVFPRSVFDDYFSAFACHTRCPHYLECLAIYRELSRMPGWQKQFLRAAAGLIQK